MACSTLRRPRDAARRAARPKFDELAYYAEHFDTVEVNTTFYGQPKATVAQTWADRTPPGFEFSLKLYRGSLMPISRACRRSTWKPSTRTAGGRTACRRAKDRGAARAVPPSFKQNPESQGYLDALLETVPGLPSRRRAAARSWSDDFASTLSLLNSHNAALTQIDEPKFKLSIRQNQLPNISGFYYMRLHGRNAAQWWKHDKSEDRYNYLYSANELTPSPRLPARRAGSSRSSICISTTTSRPKPSSTRS
jgi:uncharacterized protein YecE (DUF72 family)